MAIEYVRKHKDIPTWQRPEFSHKKDESGVAFAEGAVFVALDGGGGGGAEEAFGGPQAVVAVHFHATETAAELAGHHSGGAASHEGIENAVAGPRRGENQFSIEFFGLLGGMVGVLGH